MPSDQRPCAKVRRKRGSPKRRTSNNGIESRARMCKCGFATFRTWKKVVGGEVVAHAPLSELGSIILAQPLGRCQQRMQKGGGSPPTCVSASNSPVLYSSPRVGQSDGWRVDGVSVKYVGRAACDGCGRSRYVLAMTTFLDNTDVVARLGPAKSLACPPSSVAPPQIGTFFELMRSTCGRIAAVAQTLATPQA